MVQREERVVTGRQGCRQPRGRCVARRAGSRPSRGYMVGICRPGEVRLMTRVAGGRCSRKDIVDVALDAIHCRVRACERERRAVVVECGPGPRSSRVAGVAGGRESGSSMGGISCSVPVRSVTAVTGGWQCCVVSIGVASRTCHGCMGSSKWECSVVVIERR